MATLTPKIQKALLTAARLHWNQTRKGDGLPYVTHPYAVAFIVARYTSDEDTIAAAFLHDVLEDVPKDAYDDTRMIAEFGDRVYEIVKGVSEEKDADISQKSEKDTWEQRKQQYLKNLETDSEASLIVCAADKIHNLSSMIEAYRHQGEALFHKFNSPPGKKLWFYAEVLAVLKRRLNNDIVKELEQTYTTAAHTFHLDIA